MKAIHSACALLLVLIAGCDDPLIPRTLLHYDDIAAGTHHACAISEDGVAFCWGQNNRFQLGTGNTIAVDMPAPVGAEPGQRFSAITAGDGHTCALDLDGAAWCWGWNPYGQRGNGTEEWGGSPIPVETELRFKAIDAGMNHTCAIAEDDTVHCWGDGRMGQLGNSTAVTDSSGIVMVEGDLRARSISAGAYHTCAVALDGQGFCWGLNEQGQLGIGSDAVNVTVPTPLGGSRRWVAISAGVSHSCAISSEQLPFCWGSNAYGELGDRNRHFDGIPQETSPIPVSRAIPVVDIDAADHFSCMVGDDGMGYCWGRGREGQLGVGSTTHHSVPQPIYYHPGRQMTSDRFHFDEISASAGTFACGLVEGSAFCWGTGDYGQLGVGRNTYSALPQRVRG